MSEDASAESKTTPKFCLPLQGPSDVPSTSRGPEPNQGPQPPANGGRSAGLRRSTRRCVLNRTTSYYPKPTSYKRSKKESIKRVNQWLDQNFQESGENPGSLTPLERQENSGNNA